MYRTVRTMRIAVILACAGVTAAPSAAHAMMVDIPLPALVARSDLIAIVDVVEAGGPAERTLHPPGYTRPLKGWFRKFAVTIKRTLRDASAPKEGAEGTTQPAQPQPGPRQIEIFARAPKPRPPAKPGGPVVRVVDGLAYPNLRVGTSYVLILRKFATKPEYFLSAYPKNFRVAIDKNVAEVEKFADVEKWPWGKDVGGLRIAMVPTKDVLFLYKRPKGEPTVYVQVTVAVRNTTDKPLAINLYEWDKHLTVYCSGPGGKALRYDMYSYLKASRKRKRPFSARFTAVVPARGLVLIGPSAVAEYGLGLNLPLTPGKWTLQVAYESNREGIGKEGLKLWSGKIVSAPAPIEIKQYR